MQVANQLLHGMDVDTTSDERHGMDIDSNLIANGTTKHKLSQPLPLDVDEEVRQANDS